MSLARECGDWKATAARWSGHGLLFILGWITLVAYLAPLGFAPLVGLSGLIAVPLLIKDRRIDLWPLAILALVLAWMTLSYLWSPFHPSKLPNAIALKLLFQMTGGLSMVAGLAALPPNLARRGAVILAVGLALLSLLLIADALAGAGIYQALKVMIGQPIRPDLARRNIAGAAYAIALLFWPAAQAASRLGWRVAIVPLALMAGAVLAAERLLGADAPLYALIAGGVVWLTVRWIGSAAARLLLGLGVAVFTLAPLLILESLRNGTIAKLHQHVAASWAARLDIWSFAAAMAAHHPLRGWGIDASRTFGIALPLHPHNAALQIWLELGAPGAALAAALTGWIAATLAVLARANPSHAAAGAGALTAYLIIGGISFGVWQEWWVALGFLTVATLAMLRRAWPSA